ncbi:MAG: MBL fold metallo-hydrolase, partial [Okeania sp. SIO2H7]|nr:MBL fold metallo-hydrolase [Okeania sp. SIO2H7]
MFKITIRGQIEEIDDKFYLACADGNKFKISSSQEYVQGDFLWEVVPSIDPEGVIQSLQMQSFSTEGEEECFMAGTVVQLRQKNSSVQLKIKRSLKKTLRLTLLSAPLETMKAGQTWWVSCIRQGKSLLISTAEQLETNQEPPRSLSELSPVAVEPKQTEKAAFLELEKKAIATLATQTNSAADSWRLKKPKIRENIIEWDAINTTTNGRARVQLNRETEETNIWSFNKTPKTANISEEDKRRLIVTPLGAARSIGASCFQIKIGPYEIVLDCGTRPKGYDPLPALDYLENPDLLLVSHSHQDHIGAVPVFQAIWPGTPIICTEGTREIARVMLRDCLKVQQREDFPELFDSDDLERTLFRMETAPVGVDIEPLPGLIVRFINAGHILGAACIYLRYRFASENETIEERSLLYTGDFHTASSRTTTGLMLKDLPQADMLIIESTYGAGTHPSRRTEETGLIEAIASVVKAGGNVLIPAFALGRAQEIILAIRTSALFH